MAKRGGEPTLHRPLWMAACWEAAALEAAALGNRAAAEQHLHRSREIIADACGMSA
ncbi:MAG: hypothetical protein KDA21_12420 [Phycisphaerales bacterium]|nr:hypothetical protein [Phycisphaerales bacterium]